MNCYVLEKIFLLENFLIIKFLSTTSLRAIGNKFHTLIYLDRGFMCSQDLKINISARIRRVGVPKIFNSFSDGFDTVVYYKSLKN